MSGSFNQDKNQGWNVFQPRTHGAKFDLVKSMAVKPGAYEAHMEGGGVLVFDTASKPSKI